MSTNPPKTFHIEPVRMVIVYTILAVLFGFYAFRLFSFQIISGSQYVDQAYDNRIDEVNVQTTRGSILDRNGYVLARNVPSYNVVIKPANLPDDDGAIQNIFRELGALIEMQPVAPEPDEQTAKLFKPCETEGLAISQIVYIGDTNAPYRDVRIKCNVDERLALVIKERVSDWPGVSIEVVPVREYPTGSITAEIVGFLGPIPAGAQDDYPGFDLNRDKVGFAGIEQSMQEELGGSNGKRVVEFDAAGKELRDVEPELDPVLGQNVILTIDTRLQAAARTALVEGIHYLHARQPNVTESNGAVVAMNPKTGEILALVSYPNFENNRMARVIPEYYYRQLMTDPGRPLFNHAISAEHPPGSVFKLAAAIGILNEGVVTPDYIIDDPGKITLPQKFLETGSGIEIPINLDYVCWKADGHGKVDFLRGLAYSCDVYFYKVGGGYKDEVKGNGLGIWRLGEYARALGYDLLTGIELPGEQSGLIPDPDWKRLVKEENWATGDTYIGTIGQGYVLSTPLQVMQSIAVLANDGKMVKPTLIKDITDQEGHIIKEFQPQVLADITAENKLRCSRETNKCYIDTLNLCNLERNNCKRGDSGSDYDEEIDPDYYPKMGGVINVLDANGDPTGESKTVAPWVIQMAKQGMRLVVTEGTAKEQLSESVTQSGYVIESAGKTGTAEYCDDLANIQKLCETRGNWPAHAWYVGYAPYDDPEIIVMAFVYHGEEGSVFAGPVVRKILETYFELKAVDSESQDTPTQ